MIPKEIKLLNLDLILHYLHTHHFKQGLLCGFQCSLGSKPDFYYYQCVTGSKTSSLQTNRDDYMNTKMIITSDWLTVLILNRLLHIRKEYVCNNYTRHNLLKDLLDTPPTSLLSAAFVAPSDAVGSPAVSSMCGQTEFRSQ